MTDFLGIPSRLSSPQKLDRVLLSYGFNSYRLRVNKLELELVPVGILPNKFAGWISRNFLVIGLCCHTVCRQAAQPVARSPCACPTLRQPSHPPGETARTHRGCAGAARKIPIPGPPVRPPCVAACALHRVSGASARKDAAGAQGLGFCFMRMGPRRPADAPACGCGRASPFERPTHSACKKSVK